MFFSCAGINLAMGFRTEKIGITAVPGSDFGQELSSRCNRLRLEGFQRRTRV